MSVSRWLFVASVVALSTACCCRSRCRPRCEPCPRPVAATPAPAAAPSFRGCALPIPAEVAAELEEERSRASAMKTLKEKRVKGLTFEDASLDSVVTYLRTVSGVHFFIIPRVRASGTFDDAKANIPLLDDVSVFDVLMRVTTQADLRWDLRHGVVTIGTKDEIAGPPSEAQPLAPQAR